MTINNSNFFNWLRLLTGLLICSTALMACATGPAQPKLFSYSVTMDVRTDAPVYEQPEVKVLDYSYGVANQLEIIPSKWIRSNFPPEGCCGIIHQAINAPRGDYLYFKWRVIATGEIFEDRVDLSKRLPQDMNDRGLYIAIFGSQLYVYLFPPETTKEGDGSSITTPGRRPSRETNRSLHDTLRDSAYAKKHQIYPSPL